MGRYENTLDRGLGCESSQTSGEEMEMDMAAHHTSYIEHRTSHIAHNTHRHQSLMCILSGVHATHPSYDRQLAFLALSPFCAHFWSSCELSLEFIPPLFCDGHGFIISLRRIRACLYAMWTHEITVVDRAECGGGEDVYFLEPFTRYETNGGRISTRYACLGSLEDDQEHGHGVTCMA